MVMVLARLRSTGLGGGGKTGQDESIFLREKYGQEKSLV